MTNKIVLENQKQGNPIEEWGIDGDGDPSIQGFATQISSNVGETVEFKIATDATKYRIEIYRLGYYNGDGARKVATISQELTQAQIQPHPIVDYTTGLIDCGNWEVSATWQIPEDSVSGVYIAKLVREDGVEGSSHIPFIVREDGSTSDIVFQTSDTTWQAYNAWGGASLYTGNVPIDPADMIAWMPPNCSCGLTAIGRAYKVSYNRPFITNTSPAGGTHDFIFGVEHSAIRWLEQNGYDVSYISGVDSTRNGAQLLNHQAFLSVGHDEYWSAEQRANVEAARDSGVNLAFWSGNEVYWKIRWEDSVDGNGTPYRTMVAYKETWAGVSIDPSDIHTGTWRDPRFADPGQEPENSLTGTMFTVDSYRLDTMTIPYDMSRLRFWRNTEVAELQPGETYSLVPNLLGYEWDSDVENGYRPAGLINMSSTTLVVDTYLRDYGTTIGTEEATHSLTMYRAPSGALVFGAGTVFWSWGLDENHAGAPTPTDPNVQQAMVNMFADMGIQPETLMASLVVATKSTDFLAPVSQITSPSVGAHFVEGQRVTVTGIAYDLGGGVVAGIEVSTDGGQSWWKAQGYENWTYTWTAQATGTYTIMSRAVDDSLNLETPTSSANVTVSLPDTSSIWTFANKPAEETALDRDGIEVGVRFQTSIGGEIEGIRFYKGFYNIGTHVVNLWDDQGNLIATATSTKADESLSGWQTVLFDNPVQIQAGKTYTASYFTKGYYSLDTQYFTSPITRGPITVQPGAGVFTYTTTPGVFPTESFQNSNYWVDVVFDAGPNTQPVAEDDSGFMVYRNGKLTLSFAALTANDNDADGDLLSILSVGGAQNGTVTLNFQTGTVTFRPDDGYFGPASFTYVVTDGRGGTSTATVSLTVDEAMAGISIFDEGAAPTSAPSADGEGLELGMKFTASKSGTISAMRFYKATGETGTHTASLWTASGDLLGTVTFTNESGSGWQEATFSTPITIAAGQTYVASYHSNGTYMATPGYFEQAHSNGPLTAVEASTVGGNGVYTYSSSTAFPTSSYQATNYWVDVVFHQNTFNTAPVAQNDNNIDVVRNNALVIPVSTLLANDIDIDADPLTITHVSEATNGTIDYDPVAGTITFTPDANFVGEASFTYTVEDGQGGSSTATVNMVVAPPDTTVKLFPTEVSPTMPAVNDPLSVELGVRFTATTAGTIKGIRYYKSAQDTGTHTGSVWSATGQLLATATFSNESSSGWQTVTFSQPITVAAGTTYVASYHSNGFYSASPNYFTTSHTNGVLTAPANAGVYAYGNSSVFPTQSYNATNYWVDVIFEPNTENLAPVAVNDEGFVANVGSPLILTAAALLANDSDLDADPLVITGVGQAQNGTVTFDSQTNTITFTPNADYVGEASFTYTIEDGRGGSSSATVSLSVVPPETTVKLFPDDVSPTIPADNDPGSVELGVRFTVGAAGTITGIRYYKSAQDTGTHTGTLWTATGELMTTAVFSNESASGWQTVTFSQPITVAAGTSYVASYHSNGFYAASPDYFTTSHTNGVLTAPTNAGVYAYGNSTVFPSASGATNYWVDVIFEPNTGNSAPVAVNDGGFETNQGQSLVISAAELLANDSDPDADPLVITGVSQAENGTVTFDNLTNTITFTPTAGYSGDASFTYTIADNNGGFDSATVSLSVHAPNLEQRLFSDADVPATVSVNDPDSVNLGMKFTADVDGWITGISFYKGPQNTGTHTGYLWTATGQLLSSVTFSGESASGWQTMALTEEVEIDAGTTYVVSYHTNGNYSATAGYFQNEHSSGNLTALSSALSGGNGVFAYGAAGLFPTSSYNNTNYYVDVTFRPQLAA